MRATSAILVVTAAFLLLDGVGALRCYNCVKWPKLEYLPSYHKKCRRGALPDSMLVDCDRQTPIGRDGIPLTQAEVSLLLKAGGRRTCSNFNAQVGKEKFAIKGCAITMNDPDVDSVCVGSESNHAYGNLCECHTDKCNGGMTTLPRVLLLLPLTTLVWAVRQFL